MRQSLLPTEKLSGLILTLQGDGDYAAVEELFQTMGEVSATLQGDLDRLKASNVPVDVIFDQAFDSQDTSTAGAAPDRKPRPMFARQDTEMALNVGSASVVPDGDTPAPRPAPRPTLARQDTEVNLER